MNIIHAEAAGGVEKLKIVLADDPEPGENEVLISGKAWPVNGSDIFARKNSIPVSSDKIAKNASLTQSSYMGLECSGIVEKIGPNVTEWYIGQEVCAILYGGGYAEKVVVDKDQLFLKPPQMSFAAAAAIPYAACVVWSELFMKPALNPFFWLPNDGNEERLCSDKTLLVHEDRNGICAIAMQIAKERNIEVYFTYYSDRFCNFCKDIGFTNGIKEDDFLKYNSPLKDVDVILNTGGKKFFEANLHVLKKTGILVNLSTCISDTMDFSAPMPSFKEKTDPRPKRTIIQSVSLLHRQRKEMARIVADVREHLWNTVSFLTPDIHGKDFKFSDVREAHKLMEQGNCGKVVLVPDV